MFHVEHIFLLIKMFHVEHWIFDDFLVVEKNKKRMFHVEHIKIINTLKIIMCKINIVLKIEIEKDMFHVELKKYQLFSVDIYYLGNIMIKKLFPGK